MSPIPNPLRGPRWQVLIILALAGVLAAVVLLIVLSLPWSPYGQTSKGPLLTSLFGTQKGLPLAGVARLSEGVVAPREEVEVRLRMAVGAEAPTLRMLEVVAPGFEPMDSQDDGRCWALVSGVLESPAASGNSGSDGVDPPQEPILCSQPRVLKSNQVVELTKTFTATGTPGSRRFQMAMGIDSRVLAVDLGQVEIRTWSGWLRRGIRRFYQVMKDLGMPLVLALLGGLITWAIGEYQKQQRGLAEKRERIHQTWTQLLEKYLKEAKEHYMPMAGKAMVLERELEQDATRGVPTIATFYNLIRFLSRVHLAARALGGFQFKNRQAEYVVAVSWQTFLAAAKEILNEVVLQTVLKELEKKDGDNEQVTIAEFKHQLETETPPDSRSSESLKLAWTKYVEWIHAAAHPEAMAEDERPRPLSPAQVVAVCGIFWRVVNFEVNRPFFSYWYETNPWKEFPEDKLNELSEELSIGELKEHLKAYLENAQKESAPSTPSAD